MCRASKCPLQKLTSVSVRTRRDGNHKVKKLASEHNRALVPLDRGRTSHILFEGRGMK